MNNPNTQIEIISNQEPERIESLIGRIEEGSINRINLIRELKDRIKMLNHINRINREQ